MGICYVCGKETELPHRCQFCNLTYCDEHRLPEQHNCINVPDRDWDTFRELKTAREGYPSYNSDSNSVPDYTNRSSIPNVRRVNWWDSTLVKISLAVFFIGVIVYTLHRFEITDVISIYNSALNEIRNLLEKV
jgi:hypothetical protein